METWLPAVVSGVLGASFALWRLRATSRPPEAVGTCLILRPSGLVGTLAALGGFGIPLVLFVVALGAPSLDEADVMWGGAVVVLVVGVAAMCWMASRQVLIVDDEGLEQRLPWRRVRRVAWDDVVSVRVSALPAYLELHGRNGHLIRVAPSLDGIPDLVLITKRRLEPVLWRDAIARLACWDERLAE